jgi:TRAP transporter TAXI family solute receptor
MRHVDFRQLSWRDALIVGLPLLALVIAAFAITWHYVEPATPDRLVMATGPAGGAYELVGRQYKSYLSRHRVMLDLVPSNGSVENYERLLAGTADVAFVQGGTVAAQTDPDAAAPVLSLGALYPEPVWVFQRADRKAAEKLSDLAGQKIAIGGEGSGTRKLALDLLGASGVDAANATLLPLNATEAGRALSRGEIDAAFINVGVRAPVIDELLRNPGVRLVSLAHGAALARRFAYLSPLTIPRGLVDVKGDLPPRDIATVGVNANLLVAEAVHSNLIYLLLDAATAIHGGGGLLAEAHTFPNPLRQDVPLAPEAERYYRSGKPFLQRYLPYWFANTADRLLLLLIPFVGVLIPALNFLPRLYTYRVKAKVGRWYARLRAIEADVEHDPAREHVPDHLARVDEIEREIRAATIPDWYTDRVYQLRAAIDLVRERLGSPHAKALPRLRGDVRSD